MKHSDGYTLVELLVTMAVTAILMAAVYGSYRVHTRASVTQEQVVDMVQGVRFAMYMMEREIRMAAYDITGSANARIIIADDAELLFESDFNDNGDPFPTPINDPNERIRYALTNDADLNGIADGIPCALGREVWGGGLQPIANNIDALNFVYLDNSNPRNVLPTPVADTSLIRLIQITVVARSGEEVPAAFIKYTDNQSYTNQQGDVILPARNDHFRRIRLTTEVKCRNLDF